MRIGITSLLVEFIGEGGGVNNDNCYCFLSEKWRDGIAHNVPFVAIKTALTSSNIQIQKTGDE